MRMKRGALFMLAALALASILFFDNASALSIVPSSVIYDFEPNLNKTLILKVRGTNDVDLYVKGDLKEYVKIDRTSLDCPCKYSPFTVEINLPEELEVPGTYDTRVGAIEKIPPGTEGIGGRVAMEFVLLVKVPYPGRYAVINMQADSVQVGEPVRFSMKIESRGTENISGTVKLEVFDSNGNKVATMYSDEKFIESKKSADVSLVWNTAGAKEGIYTAKATFDYGGDRPATTQEDFRVGDILIRILDVLNNETVQGDISKFVIRVESFWNAVIKDVYATMVVTKDGRTIGESQSSNVDVQPWSIRDISLFWDTGDTEPGTYDAAITVHYQNKTAEKAIQTTIVPEIGIGYLILIAAVIIIAALVVALALYYRYRMKKRKEKK